MQEQDKTSILMENTSNNFEKVIKNLDKYAIIIIILFIIVIGLSPYIFTQSWTNINFTDTGNIGSTIGGITAPFIGVLSALLVFLSFRAQINANRYQIQSIELERKNRELDNEITFLYHRLEEIKSYDLNQQLSESLSSINGMFSDMNSLQKDLISEGNDDKTMNDLKIKTQKLESDKIKPLLVLSRQISLYIIVTDKLDEIKASINSTQFEYIESSLRFEYLNGISNRFKFFNISLNRLDNNSLISENSLLFGLRTNLVKIEKRLNPSA